MASFGTSKTMAPIEPKLIANAEFYDWAPLPCCLYQICTSPHQQARMFFRAYENKYECNRPEAPLMCLTADERCVNDRICLWYYDDSDLRSKQCCFVIPLTCCGPPVVVSIVPHLYCCFCIHICSLVEYFGETVVTKSDSCCDLKQYLCCGDPCFLCYAKPLICGVKNGETLMANWSSGMDAYKQRNPELADQMAVFYVHDQEIKSVTPAPMTQVVAR